MLGDSGLQARYGSPDTFTLAAVARRAGPAETLAARQRYYGKLQAAMRALLCGDPDVRPGSYRAAVSLWFGDSGQVRRVRLLDSTGSPERDQLLTQRLGRLKLDEAAPPAWASPSPCDPAWAGRGHRRLSCITARARMRSARTAIPVRHARDRPHEGRRPGFVAQVAGHPL